MPTELIQLSDDFWNLRGSFKLGGMIDIGTQASLVRLASGRFVFLDAYTLDDQTRRQVDELTDGGSMIDAIINLHPFHTVHCERVHAQFPDAELIGTARHKQKFPGLPWAEACTEETALHAQFAEDFEFSVPAGVDFISSNENVHFSSVLALHRPSRTIHVDDTYMYMKLPGMLRSLGRKETLSFHFTLPQVLERRAGAVADFRGWAEDLQRRWGDAENVCAAHTAALIGADNPGASVAEQMAGALRKVEKKLARHERKYG